MVFDGVTIDEIILLYLRSGKLLFGILILPIIYALMKGKSWSWSILKGLFIINISLIGLEISAGYIFYEKFETGFIYYYLFPIILLSLFLYYLTKTHVHQFLLQKEIQ